MSATYASMGHSCLCRKHYPWLLQSSGVELRAVAFFRPELDPPYAGYQLYAAMFNSQLEVFGYHQHSQKMVALSSTTATAHAQELMGSALLPHHCNGPAKERLLVYDCVSVPYCSLINEDESLKGSYAVSFYVRVSGTRIPQHAFATPLALCVNKHNKFEIGIKTYLA